MPFLPDGIRPAPNTGVARAALVAITGLCSAAFANANEVCVGSATELNNALAMATLPIAGGMTIKLQQGTYGIAGTLLASDHVYSALQLLGGYNSDCSARTLRPSNTVIDGGGAYLGAFDQFGDLLIEGLSFRNMTGVAHSVYLSADGDSEDVVIQVRNSEFHGVGVTLSYFNADSGGIDFVNNLIEGAPDEGLNLQFDWQDSISAIVTNNTIVNSHSRGIFAQTEGDTRLRNNIVWNNAYRDIWVEKDNDTEAGSAVYLYNLYSTRYGSEASGSIGTLHDDPQLVSATNFRLQNTSPVINSGTSVAILPAVDLDGHPRVVGSTVDRGAYEANIDDTVPQTLTVTNTNDSGSGSLRQAILDANANPDFSFINFNIPGSCPRTITLSSALPTITQGVRIDAYSEPGTAANTLDAGDNAKRCVILNGGGSIATGLNYGGGNATQFWLQGLALEGFTGSALRLSGGSDALVWGNQFGGKMGSLALTGNGTGISMSGLSSDAHVGGANPVQRNVIAGSVYNGVEVVTTGLFGSIDNTISGNLIGTYGSETVMAGNGVGVWLATSGNTVSNNIIVNSAGDGVHLEGAAANANTISANRIGRTDTRCVTTPVPLCINDVAPNGNHGVRIEGGAHDNFISMNTIWNNSAMGISVGDGGQNNDLSANSIYANGQYGIDLDGSGLNDNDADPAAASLPNRGLNYPSITRAYGGSAHGWVEGTLDSTNGSYLIQIFSSALPGNASTGEGEVFHRTGLAGISNAQNGHTTFRIAFASPSVSLASRLITLTAIDNLGNTSEFSFRSNYQCDVIFRNGFDDGVGDVCPK